MKKMKPYNLLSVAAFVFFAFVSTNVFPNVQFEGGQYVKTWTIDDFINVPEMPANQTFWNYLTEQGANPADYIKHNVNVFYIEYQTKNPFGEQVKASGNIFVPEGVTSPMPIVMDFYGTMKTLTVNLTHFPAMWAAKGYTVFYPHHLGNNKSAGKEIETYKMADSYAQVAEDMLAAGKSILTLNNISYTNDLLIGGISKGGYAAMATAKAFQEKSIPVTLLAPFAGPYHIEYYVAGFLASPDALAALGWSGAASATKYSLSVASYSDNFPGTLHGSENYNQKIKTNIPYFLKEPFAEAFKNAYLDVENVEERMMAAKALYDALPPEEQKPLPWGIYKDDLVETMMGNPYDNPMTNFFSEQNVCFWRPEMPVLLLHGTADINVPASLSVLTYQLFKYAYQAPNVELMLYPGLDHYTCIIPARKAAMDLFDTLLTPTS
jgi:pimeloyl-ACP methyl ester carboxylesterase